MLLNIVKRPQADRDIEECFVFIAEGDLDAGVRFLVAVESSMEELSRFPKLGKRRDGRIERWDSLRIWPVRGFYRYLLFYIISEDQIELVRVLHSSRDINTIFE